MLSTESIMELERKIQEKEKQLCLMRDELKKLQTEQKTKIFEMKHFEGFESVTEAKLKSLEFSQLEYLVFKQFGPDATVGSGIYRVPVLSKHYVYGDVSTRTLSDDEYRSKLSQYL